MPKAAAPRPAAPVPARVCDKAAGPAQGSLVFMVSKYSGLGVRFGVHEVGSVVYLSTGRKRGILLLSVAGYPGGLGLRIVKKMATEKWSHILQILR